MWHKSLLQEQTSIPVPDSSYIVIADIRKSTSAIQGGKQREVNMLGAACIAAVRNNFPQGWIPYVFGGDGATFLVPQQHLARLKELLEAVQTMARVNFRLSLRVGEISVAELRAANADVSLVSLSCGEQERIYFLQGSGISLADKWIKERDSHFDEISSLLNYSKVSIKGLSCRLLPFDAQRGRIHSFIIESLSPSSEQDSVFKKVLATLGHEGELERLRPLQTANFRRAWLPKSWLLEARLFKSTEGFLIGLKAYLKAFIENVITTNVFKFNKTTSMTGLPSRYMDEFFIQSDWIKFNGALYLIMDMTAQEHQRFVSELEALEAQGQILFGTQSARSALVVCHLDSSSEKKHFHFVDGSDGGLTFAALQLKQKKAKQLSAFEQRAA